MPVSTGNGPTDQALADIRRDLDKVKRAPHVEGNLVTGVALTTVVAPIAHKLGRRVKGYFIAGATVAAMVTDENAGKLDLDKFCYLKASTAGDFSFWFF